MVLHRERVTTRPMKGKNMLFCIFLCDGRFGLGDEMMRIWCW